MLPTLFSFNALPEQRFSRKRQIEPRDFPRDSFGIGQTLDPALSRAGLLIVGILSILAFRIVPSEVGQVSETGRRGLCEDRDCRFLLTTNGINVDPGWLSGRPESLVSAPLKLTIRGQLRGKTVELTEDFRSLGAGFSLAGPAGDGVAEECRIAQDAVEGRVAECGIRVLRFAQFGSAGHLTWLVQSEDGPEGMRGVLRGEIDENGRLRFPARLILSGKMVLSFRESGRTARLRSEGRVELEGIVGSWPPYDAGWPPTSTILQLSGEPVLFREMDSQAVSKEPATFSLQQMWAVLGTRPSDFFSTIPRIAQARVIDPSGADWRDGPVGGVALEWTDSRKALNLSGVTHYNIYRNQADGPVYSWSLQVRIAAGKTSYVDRDFDGTRSYQYLVTHGAQFPMGYLYEGMYGEPRLVASCLRPTNSRNQ